MDLPDGATRPQDHLPPAMSAVTGPFTFEAEGKTFILPDADEVRQSSIPARVLRSAADPSKVLGETQLMFATIDTSGADQETLDALYGLPIGDVLKIFVGWSQHKTSPEAASLGESGDSPT